MKPKAYVKPPHVCTPDCFWIYRDGVWLQTRECREKLRQDDIDHNRYQKKRRKL